MKYERAHSEYCDYKRKTCDSSTMKDEWWRIVTKENEWVYQWVCQLYACSWPVFGWFGIINKRRKTHVSVREACCSCTTVGHHASRSNSATKTSGGRSRAVVDGLPPVRGDARDPPDVPAGHGDTTKRMQDRDHALNARLPPLSATKNVIVQYEITHWH